MSEEENMTTKAKVKTSQLDLKILFKAFIEATRFDRGTLKFVKDLGDRYRQLWNSYRAIDISLAQKLDWRQVPVSSIPQPTYIPRWDDVFARCNHLQMVNVAGFNYDIRSRASEYADLFELDEEEVRECEQEDDFFDDHPQCECPKWYAEWSGYVERKFNAGAITFRDLAQALSDIKSGKQDDNYELFANAHVSFPNADTVRIDVNFDHGS
jgi:hypothetical protein